MRTKKFDKDRADKMWSDYMKGLMDTIKESEDEGLEKGLSSYEIEVLWQQKMKERAGQEKARKSREKENQDTSRPQK